MPAQDALIGKTVLADPFDDVEEALVAVGDQPVRRSLREHQEVALAVRERAVVGLHQARASMDEVAQVAVRVAQEVRRRVGPARDVDRQVVVEEDPLPPRPGPLLVGRTDVSTARDRAPT